MHVCMCTHICVFQTWILTICWSLFEKQNNMIRFTLNSTTLLIRVEWVKDGSREIDRWSWSGDEGYLNSDDSKWWNAISFWLYHIFRGKANKFGIIYKMWNAIYQDIWPELYITYNKIPDFKETIELF